MDYKLFGNNVYFDIVCARVHDDSNRPRKTKGCSIVKDIMYIHPYVSNNLEQFYYLMERVSKIVFEKSLYFGSQSKFNEIFLPKPSIRQIVFNETFNVPFVLTPYITHLVFGARFNQSIILNSSIVFVQFGSFFNQSIKISKKLAILFVGNSFNKNLDLNKHLKVLGTRSQHFAARFSKNLKYLELRNCTYTNVDLPKCLRWLCMRECSIQSIKLTPNIKYLMIDKTCCKNIIIECSKIDMCLCIRKPNYLTDDNLPNNVKHITYEYFPSFANIPNNTYVNLSSSIAISNKKKMMFKKNLSRCDNFLYLHR